MASNIEFVEFVADQLRDAGNIRYQKMFGEYGLYCNGKFFAVILDNQLFIKFTDEVKEMYPNLPIAHRYGAGNHFLIDDIENREMLTKLVTVTCDALPEPKPKKRKTKI